MNIVLPCKNNTPTAKRTPHEAAFCADLRVEAHLLEDGQQLETFAATIQHCLQHEGILSKRVVFLDFSPSRRPDLEVVLTVVRNARLQPLAKPSTGAELGIQFSDEIDILGRVVQKGFGQSARHPNIGARFLVHLQNGRIFPSLIHTKHLDALLHSRYEMHGFERSRLLPDRSESKVALL